MNSVYPYLCRYVGNLCVHQRVRRVASCVCLHDVFLRVVVSVASPCAPHGLSAPQAFPAALVVQLVGHIFREQHIGNAVVAVHTRMALLSARQRLVWRRGQRIQVADAVGRGRQQTRSALCGLGRRRLRAPRSTALGDLGGARSSALGARTRLGRLAWHLFLAVAAALGEALAGVQGVDIWDGHMRRRRRRRTGRWTHVDFDACCALQALEAQRTALLRQVVVPSELHLFLAPEPHAALRILAKVDAL